MSIPFKDIFRLTTPVGMGYLPTGFAFGVLATQAGLPLPLVMAMSLFIFAGALQFAAVPMLLGGAGFATIALTTLLINLRHILYAIPLLNQLPRGRFAKAYVIGALTDENYSVLTTLPAPRSREIGTWLCLVNHAYWLLGTLIGAAFGLQAARWIPNLDFALPALFTILAIEQYRAKQRAAPVVVGLSAYLAAYFVAPDYALIVSLGLSLAVLLASPVRHAPPPLSTEAES